MPPADPAALIAEAVERICVAARWGLAGAHATVLRQELLAIDTAAEARGFERGKVAAIGSHTYKTTATNQRTHEPAAEDGELADLRAAIHAWHFGPNYISAEQRLVEIAERNDAAMRAAKEKP